MEKRIAQFMAQKTISCGVLVNGKVLSFGYELLIIAFVGIMLMVVVSCYVQQPLAWIPFLIGFAPLRTTAGGFHANKQWKCYIVSTCIYAACLLYASKIVSVGPVQIVLAAVTAVITWCMAPVEAINKPLSETKRNKNRLRSIIIVCMDMIVAIITCLAEISNVAISLFFLGGISASISLVVAKVINILGKEDTV